MKKLDNIDRKIIQILQKNWKKRESLLVILQK